MGKNKKKKQQVQQNNRGGNQKKSTNNSMKKAYQNSVDTKKVHTGTIKFMDLRKGYGFVVDNETGKEIFFHHSNIEEGRTFTGFVADDIIEFTLKPGAKGIEANCMVLSVPVEEQNNVDEESQEEEVSEEEIDEDSVEEDEEVPEEDEDDDTVDDTVKEEIRDQVYQPSSDGDEQEP